MDEVDAAFLASLDRLVADAVAESAGRERAQIRRLRQISEESATFVGVTLDLAERGEVVMVRSTTGRAHRGRVVAVGRDFIIVRDGPGPPVVLASAWVSSVRPLPGAGPQDAAGDRRAPLDLSLATLLASVAGDRPRVQVTAAGDGQPLAGELRAAGHDVITLLLHGGQRLVAYVRVAALAEVVLVDHP